MATITRERWASLSVKDHMDTRALITDLLLYDRLVIPIPQEKAKWEKEKWKVDLLEKRLDQLGDLAVKVLWDSKKRDMFRERMESIKRIRADTNSLISDFKETGEAAYEITREILACDNKYNLPKGIVKADVIPAFRSKKEFSEDFIINSPSQGSSYLGLLIGQKIVVPAFTNEKDEEAVLDLVIDFVKDKEFRVKRNNLHEWQNKIIHIDKIEPEKAIEELDSFVRDYNDCIKRVFNKKYERLAYLVGGVALGFAGIFFPLIAASGSALVAVVEFMRSDKKEVETEKNSPAAMFHDIQKELKWKIDLNS